jgi:alpha-N-arabinofuranosidase
MGKTFGDGAAVVADVDYLRVATTPAAAAETAPATLRVDCAAPGQQLNRMRFGHFIEHLANCLDGGLWAEMLFDRKFTGKVGGDGAVEGWTPLGPRAGVALARDNDRFYCPSQAQRLEVAQAGPLAGVQQGKLVLRAGTRYQVRLVAMQQGLASPVVVGLRAGEQVLAQAELRDIGADWTVRQLELAGPAARTEAQFFVATAGPGTLWLGAVSLMPADNLDGFRADVVEALRRIKPPVIRWPGGNFASGYDWRDGIGERDRRPPRWNRAWNQWEWNDVGTHEFLRLCELLGAAPYITVNAGEGNATEAAAWVEYCNGSADTRWGSVRAAHGHPAPWRVPIWSLGNEMYGDWQLGHLTATDYGLKAVEFARAMRAVDPGVKLIGDGVDGGSWGGWNREVCQIAGRQLDWLSVHYYLEVDDFADPVLTYSLVIGASQPVEQMLRQTSDLARQAAGKPLPLALDEWNIPHPGWPASLRDGIFACELFNALNRLGDRVTMANLALMVNVMGVVNANADGLDVTGTYRAFELYANNSGDLAVPVQVSAETVDLPGAPGCPVLDASATLSADRKTLYLAVVNRQPLRPVGATVELPGFVPAATARVRTLNAEKVTTINSQAKPDGIRLTDKDLPVSAALAYEFPPHSATVLRFAAQ